MTGVATPARRITDRAATGYVVVEPDECVLWRVGLWPSPGLAMEAASRLLGPSSEILIARGYCAVRQHVRARPA